MISAMRFGNRQTLLPLALALSLKSLPRRVFLSHVSFSTTVLNSRCLPLSKALCDRHPPNAVALRYQQSMEGPVHEVTFGSLSDRSKRLAHALQDVAGIERGDIVAGMLPKGPHILELAVALARLGAIYQPLFTAFQSDGIQARIGRSVAVKAIVTDQVNQPKWNDLLQKDQAMFCIQSDNNVNSELLKDCYDYHEMISSFDLLPEEDHFEETTNPNHPMALLYSSGTTGPPKGILCPAKALDNFQIYLEQGLGLQLPQETRYWNIADPGWAYGLYYNVYGPLYTGVTAHMLVAPFTPESTLQFLAQHHITSFAAAPTVYRAIRSVSDPSLLQTHAPAIAQSIRTMSSAGEPLSPSVSAWFQDTLGISSPILNHYGQTENGMMVNQHCAGPRSIVKKSDPTSCGVPMEGFEGACLLDPNGTVIDAPGIEGELCMKVDECPLFWFQGYYQRDASAADEQGYYHTGDQAQLEVDEDGNQSFVFSGRNDDVITSAGYRVGPAEIEGSIMQLDHVLEVAVVGVPDDLKGEAIQAFVVLKPSSGSESDDPVATEKSIRRHVKLNLAKHLAPKTVTFVQSLPKTDSGKIKRYLLRQGILE